MNMWVLNNPQMSNADPTSISFQGYFTTLASYNISGPKKLYMSAWTFI